MAFWSVATGLCLIVLASLLVSLLRGRASAGSAAEFDLRVYRDQLRDLDKDVARGVVSSEDSERLRVEISRRILDADKAAQSEGAASQAPKGLTYGVFAACAVGVIGGGMWMYTSLGAPGYPDLPLADRIAAAALARAERPDQATAQAETMQLSPPPSEDNFSADYLRLVAQLREAVANRPDDVRGHDLLARQEAGMGRFDAAWPAKARAIELKGPEAASAQDFVDLADLMVLAAGGYVSPEAERILGQALQRDPGNGVARYYTGLMLAQTGRPDQAFNVWANLLAESAADAPWQDPIRAQIDNLAAVAGVDYVAPAIEDAPQASVPTVGPSAEQVEAAQDMSVADRMAMIEGMVSGLSERLANDGGPPEDWARLIRAYGVLGNQQAAAAIWAEAQQVFPDDITRVQILEAARDAGVAQ